MQGLDWPRRTSSGDGHHQRPAAGRVRGADCTASSLAPDAQRSGTWWAARRRALFELRHENEFLNELTDQLDEEPIHLRLSSRRCAARSGGEALSRNDKPAGGAGRRAGAAGRDRDGARRRPSRPRPSATTPAWSTSGRSATRSALAEPEAAAPAATSACKACSPATPASPATKLGSPRRGGGVVREDSWPSTPSASIAHANLRATRCWRRARGPTRRAPRSRRTWEAAPTASYAVTVAPEARRAGVRQAPEGLRAG